MTTTDANGIVFLEDTDDISPFHTLINGLQTATSTAVEKAGRGPLYAVDNTARDALLTQHGASSTNPLWVDVAGTLERNAGSGWQSVGGGVVAKALLTASTSAVTAETYSGLSVTVDADGGDYLIEVSSPISASVATDRTLVSLRRGITTGDTQVASWIDVLNWSSNGLNRSYRVVDTPSAGSVTYGVFVARGGGTGTVSLAGTALAPSLLTVSR